MGLEAPEPLEAEGKLCLLVSWPGHDPVGGAVGRAMPREQRRVPANDASQALVARGLSSCTQALAGVVSRAGAKGRARMRR
jgi:hypothetical protein